MNNMTRNLFISVSVTFLGIPTMACSNSFCVNSEMPLLYQSSKRLVTAISKLERDTSIDEDPGWCIPVASTMAFAGSLKKSKNMSYSYSSLNAMRDYDLSWNSDVNSETFSNSIYQVGELMRTNWRRGGTSLKNRNKGFKKVYNSIRGNVSKNYIEKMTKHSSYNVSYFKNLFKGKYPATLLSVKKMDQRKRFLLGHGIALNGYEGSTLKIYDPWGRIYNVRLSSTGTRSYPKISHVKGRNGSIEKYNRGNTYAALYSFASFSVTDRTTQTKPGAGGGRRPVPPPRYKGRWR